jgi:hypothetical protein
MRALRSDKKASADTIGTLLVLLLMAGYLLLNFYIGFAGETNVTDTVIGKERVTKNTFGDINSYYVIYGQNETYQVTDSWIKNRFNSSDLYGHIEKDKTYEFHTIGLRVPILSHYPNIMSAKEEGINDT